LKCFPLLQTVFPAVCNMGVEESVANGADALSECNDPTIGSYNYYHLSPNGIPRGNQRWYGLVCLIQIAGKPRIRPRE